MEKAAFLVLSLFLLSSDVMGAPHGFLRRLEPTLEVPPFPPINLAVPNVAGALPLPIMRAPEIPSADAILESLEGAPASAEALVEDVAQIIDDIPIGASQLIAQVVQGGAEKADKPAAAAAGSPLAVLNSRIIDVLETANIDPSSDLGAVITEAAKIPAAALGVGNVDVPKIDVEGDVEGIDTEAIVEATNAIPALGDFNLGELPGLADLAKLDPKTLLQLPERLEVPASDIGKNLVAGLNTEGAKALPKLPGVDTSALTALFEKGLLAGPEASALLNTEGGNVFSGLQKIFAENPGVYQLAKPETEVEDAVDSTEDEADVFNVVAEDAEEVAKDAENVKEADPEVVEDVEEGAPIRRLAIGDNGRLFDGLHNMFSGSSALPLPVVVAKTKEEVVSVDEAETEEIDNSEGSASEEVDEVEIPEVQNRRLVPEAHPIPVADVDGVSALPIPVANFNELTSEIRAGAVNLAKALRGDKVEFPPVAFTPTDIENALNPLAHQIQDTLGGVVYGARVVEEKEDNVEADEDEKVKTEVPSTLAVFEDRTASVLIESVLALLSRATRLDDAIVESPFIPSETEEHATGALLTNLLHMLNNVVSFETRPLSDATPFTIPPALANIAQPLPIDLAKLPQPIPVAEIGNLPEALNLNKILGLPSEVKPVEKDAPEEFATEVKTEIAQLVPAVEDVVMPINLAKLTQPIPVAGIGNLPEALNLNKILGLPSEVKPVEKDAPEEFETEVKTEVAQLVPAVEEVVMKEE